MRGLNSARPEGEQHVADPAPHLEPYRFRPGQCGNPRGRPRKAATGLRQRLATTAEGDLTQLREIATAALERAKTEEDGRGAAALLTVATEAIELRLSYAIGKPWDGRPEDLDRQEEASQDAGVSLLATVTALGAEEPQKGGES